MTPKSILFSLFSILCLSHISCQDTDFFDSREDDPFAFPLDSTSEYILVIGDVQYYTFYAANARNQFKPTMDWIKGMAKRGYQIPFILQTGDLTETNADWEYKVFDYYTRPLANQLLYLTVTGNHDYDWSGEVIPQRQSTRIGKYFDYPLTQSHVVSQYQEGSMTNYIVKAQLRNRPIYVIALEFGAGPEVLTWAVQYVQAHPQEPFILLTHEFLNRNGTRVDDDWSYARRQFVGDSNSTPQEIWNILVKPHDNVRCVLCGHNGFSVQRYDANDAGRLVPQILMNLQYLPNGGDGWIQVWQVPADPTDSIDVRLINARTNELYRDSTDEVFNYHKAHFRFML